MRSDVLKHGIDTLPHRSLVKAAGIGDGGGPFIGVANAYTDLIPGHVHLNELTEEVKRGICDAGGVPALLGRLRRLLADGATVSGPTTLEIADRARPTDDEVIRPLDRPYSPEEHPPWLA